MALRELLAEFDIKIPGAAKLKTADKAIDSTADKLRQFAQVYTADQIVGGMRNFVNGLVQQSTGLEDVSAQLGLSTRELQQWQLAGSLAGAKTEDMNKAILNLQKNSEGGAKVFKELGVELKDGAGNAKSTSTLMRETGLAIGGLEDPAARTKAALEVFGKAGSKLVPMFSDGAAGLEDMLAELDRLGGGLSEDAIRKIGAFDDGMVRWDFAMLSVKSTLATDIFPALTGLVGNIAKVTSEFATGEGGSRRMGVALGLLGTIGAVAGVKMLAPWLPLILAITGGYLVIEDLITAIEGGDSVIEDVLDSLFGKGTGESIFAAARADLEAFQAKMKEEGKTGADTWVAGIKAAGASVKGFFVDEIPQAVRDAYDRVANDIGSNADKFVVGFVESIKTSLVGLPIYFAATAGKAAAQFIAKLRDSWNGSIKDLASSLGASFSSVFADAIKVPTLDIGGADVNAPGSYVDPRAPRPDGFFETGVKGALGLPALLFGDASGAGGGRGRGGATLNQTNNFQIGSGASPYMRGDVLGALDDANESGVRYLEEVIG